MRLFAMLVISGISMGTVSAAEPPTIYPESVSVTDNNELAFTWEGQGTLICNGLATNSLLRVPEDLPYGPAIECWVEFPEGRSNSLTLNCKRSKCTVSGSGRSTELFLDTESAAPTSEPSEPFQPSGQAPIFEPAGVTGGHDAISQGQVLEPQRL